MTLDSIHLIWTGDNYTGSEGIRIGYTLPIGQPRNSTVLPSTSAELVSKSEVNGRLQLTSRLTITASDEGATDQIHSVTCSNNVMDASNVTFHVTTGMSIGSYYYACRDVASSCLFAISIPYTFKLLI